MHIPISSLAVSGPIMSNAFRGPVADSVPSQGYICPGAANTSIPRAVIGGRTPRGDEPDFCAVPVASHFDRLEFPALRRSFHSPKKRIRLTWLLRTSICVSARRIEVFTGARALARTSVPAGVLDRVADAPGRPSPADTSPRSAREPAVAEAAIELVDSRGLATVSNVCTPNVRRSIGTGSMPFWCRRALGPHEVETALELVYLRRARAHIQSVGREHP